MKNKPSSPLNYINESDKALFHWMFSLTHNRNCNWIIWLSRTGDGYLYLFLGGMLWWLEPLNGPLFLYTALLAYAFELPIYVVLKKAVKRARPCDLSKSFHAHITPSDKFSLPSGHTAAAFLMATMISHFYPLLSPIAYIWATGIGLSRVLLGVHYPTDIIAGAILGISIATLSISVL